MGGLSTRAAGATYQVPPEGGRPPGGWRHLPGATRGRPPAGRLAPPATCHPRPRPASDPERAAVLAGVRAAEQGPVADDDRLPPAERAAFGLPSNAKADPLELPGEIPQRRLEAHGPTVDPEAPAVDGHLRVPVRQQPGQE